MKHFALIRTHSVQQIRSAQIALVSGIAGVLSAAPIGTPLRAALLGSFVLFGVGSAITAWVNLPPAAVLAAIPTLSLAAVISMTSILAWTRAWSPSSSCVVLSVGVASIGILRLCHQPPQEVRVVRLDLE